MTTYLLHRVYDMVVEEHMVLLECLMIVDKHQPKPTESLHIIGIMYQILLPEYLESAINPSKARTLSLIL